MGPGAGFTGGVEGAKPALGGSAALPSPAAGVLRGLPAPPWRRRGLRAAKQAFRERGQVGRALPRGEVLRREVLRVREAELRRRRRLALDSRRRLEELAGRRRRRRAEPARAVERRRQRLRVRRVGKMGRAELFPLLAAQLLLLPLTEVLREEVRRQQQQGAEEEGGADGLKSWEGRRWVTPAFVPPPGWWLGSFSVAAAPERPRRLLCQPQQQLILHGLLMRQERGGRGSSGGSSQAVRAAAAEGDRQGEEASEKPVTGNGGGESPGRRAWRRAAGRRVRGGGRVRPATEQGRGCSSGEGGVQHPQSRSPSFIRPAAAGGDAPVRRRRPA